MVSESVNKGRKLELNAISQVKWLLTPRCSPFHKHNWSRSPDNMHRSSAYPRGRTPGQPGKYVGEFKEMDWILCPWVGENSPHCVAFEEKGLGEFKFIISRTAITGTSQGFIALPKPRGGMNSFL